MPENLSQLFTPHSIAVVGASRSPEKVGAIVLKNILASKFSGQVYPVNPKQESSSGQKYYPDLTSLPEIPDLVVAAIPAAGVIEVLEQAGKKGIKNAVVFSAGFKESGPSGQELEKRLIEVCRKYSINLIGPNCLGFVNNLAPVNVTFGEIVQQPGNLRFISQSGAIASSLFDWCKATNLGFSEFITLGNKTILNENNILQYFLDTLPAPLPTPKQQGLSDNRPVGLYLESISDGPTFLNLARQISRKDPVFIIKPGKSAAAAKAMQSHTGAIAGEDYILEAALAQAGVLRASTMEDFFDLSRAFAWENPPEGPKVVIVSNAGGPGVISADAVAASGLELAQIDEATKKELKQILPETASVLNPVDVLGDALADRFAQACDTLLQKDQVDSLVVILTPQVMTEIGKTAEALGELSKKYRKPIMCSFIGGTLVAEGEQILNRCRIPSFRFPERAINALAMMWRFRQYQQSELTTEQVPSDIPLDRIQIEKIIKEAKDEGQETLDNLQADSLINTAGIPTPPTQFVSTLEEAKSFTEKYGWPVVLKLSSPGMLHKKKVGGVITGIGNNELLSIAWLTLKEKIATLPQGTHNQIKIQIQKSINRGVEVILGVKTDPTFGKILLFGAGGSLVELVADRNLYILPLNLPQAKQLVEKSKIYALLKGKENEPPYPLEKLYRAILSLGNLAQNVPEASDIEINPLIVTPTDVWGVDPKVILSKKKVSASPNFQTATLLSHTVLAGSFHYFLFETTDLFNPQPGQYINVKVSENRLNCYSVAGLKEPGRFNLLVDISPGGPGSKFFANLKTGDKMDYLGPFGSFTLNLNDGAKKLLFLGTGCGLAPLKYMIDAALIEKKSALPVSLYFGLTSPQDVFGTTYYRELVLRYPNFKFKTVVWKPGQNWSGPSGFITQYLQKDFPDTSDCAAYLSGNKDMITDATKLLLESGCPKERIYTEKV